ncbi:hypothetical protein F5Y06DRAFT_271664 [Hypoxylon sp. FL0890]|nr:hypothetical protein F5Y06DRAFT_271664 [Hypoxylon sp. FL0890]
MPEISIFFKLPPEVRRMIYVFVLKKDNPIQICGWDEAHINPDMDGRLLHISESNCQRGSGSLASTMHTAIARGTRTRQAHHTSLLTVCKGIHFEAIPVLFSANMLVVDFYFNIELLQDWIVSIGDNVQYFKKLTLWVNIAMIQHLALARLLRMILVRAGSVRRVILLFQSELHEMDLEIMNDQDRNEPDSLASVLEWEPGETPRRIAIGFYPTLVHAFNDLKDQYG